MSVKPRTSFIMIRPKFGELAFRISMRKGDEGRKLNVTQVIKASSKLGSSSAGVKWVRADLFVFAARKLT